MRRLLHATLSILTALSLSSCRTSTTSQVTPPEPEARFIVFADSQFSRPDVFERAVHEANMLRPDFVIQAGDLIQGYTYDREQLRSEWSRFLSQIEPLEVPYYPVPGNHDVVTDESEEIYAEVWGPDRYNYSFNYGPAHLVVLDSYYKDEDDRIAEWQREWLAQDLAAWYADKPRGVEGSVFVFLHAPFWRYAEDTPGRKDWTAVEEILRQYPVRLVIGGHTHEHVYQQNNGIDYLVMNTSGGMGGNEARAGQIWSMLHVSVKGDDVRFGTIQAGSVLPLDTVMNEERKSVPRYQLKGGTLRVVGWNEGEPFDGTVTLSLANNLDESRRYSLEWSAPFGSNVKIEPDETEIELGAKETSEIAFRISTPSAPPPSELPWLDVSTTKELRTGVVSRKWETVYRDRAARAAAGEQIHTTSIPLDAPVTFRARHSLFLPPVATAAARSGEIVIDGSLDDAAWSKAAPITDFHAGDGTPEVETSIRLLYDEGFLYVAARFAEPNMAGTRATAGGNIPLTWNDDDLELFFDSENTQGDYTRLFQNIAGTRFNSFPRNVENKYFQATYKSAIAKGADHWTLEMQIPWSETGAKGPAKAGDEWGFNIGRHRPQGDQTEYTWAGGLYDATRYGILRFE